MYYFRRTHSVDGDHGRRAINKEEDMVRIKDGVPAIIDSDLWGRVQSRLEINRRKGGARKAKLNYLLSTKIYCGECGGAMVGTTFAKGRYRYSYYECNIKKRLHDCQKKNIKKESIEELVIGQIQNSFTDDFINHVADMAVKISREESDNTEEIKNIQQRIKNVSKVIKNVADAIAQGIITETTRNMLIQAEDEKNMLKLQLAQEQLAVKNLINREMVVDWLRRYQHVDITDTEMCRSIIDSLIHKVIVYEDGHVILILSYSGKKINASLEGKALLDDLVTRAGIEPAIPP